MTDYVINGYHSQKSEVFRYSRYQAHFEVDSKSETKRGIQRSLKVISENVTKLSLNIVNPRLYLYSDCNLVQGQVQN